MAKTLEELIPEYIRGLPAYIPGRPIEEVERELKIHAIKLASNENPIGPSPKAVEAVKNAVGDANRYPDGGQGCAEGVARKRSPRNPQRNGRIVCEGQWPHPAQLRADGS